MTRYDVLVERLDAHAESVHGRLAGVDLTSIQITEGYYTDSRIQAQLTTHGDDGWERGERLRISLITDGAHEALITGFVTERSPTIDNGTVSHAYTIDSSMYALSTDLLTKRWTVQGSALDAVGRVMWLCGRPYDARGAVDRRVGATVYDVGTTYLSMCFDLLSSASRLDVDGNGNITIRRYTPPSSRSATSLIDPEARDSIVAGSVSTTDSSLSTPGRVIAKSGSGDDERWAVADVDPSSGSSSAVRGYMVAETVDDSSQDADYASLLARAKAKLASEQDPGTEHSLTVVWSGYHAGDMCEILAYGTRRKCLVKSVETDFSSMTQKLTLKEV